MRYGRRMKRLLAVLLLGACGGDPPSCQDAVTQFYSVGCGFYDLNTGDQYPAGEVIAQCRQALASSPESCEDEIGDFLECIANVDGAAECTDCTDEQDATLTCD
jgi:hypothetical protein